MGIPVRMNSRVAIEIRALLIAGPTASGKSAAALALARRFGATIVNADSMQVYRDLRVLTARPDADEKRLAPHRLFGEIDGAVNFSVGALAEARRVACWPRRTAPLLFVGGTGLYFRALTQGLSDIPRVPEEVRERSSRRGRGRADAGAARRASPSVDPADGGAAAAERPAAHVARARSVRGDAAVRSPRSRSAREPPPLGAGRMGGPVPRARARRAQRAHRRPLRRPCCERARSRKSRRSRGAALDPALPVMRAHGVPHLIAHLEGRLSLAEAAALVDPRHAPLRQAAIHLGAPPDAGFRLGRAGGRARRRAPRRFGFR